MDIRLRTVFAYLLLSIPALGFAQPVVNLTATKSDAAEAGQAIGTIQVSIETSLVSQLTVYMQLTGSATYTIDFLTSGMNYHGADRWSIVIPAGQTSASGTITPRKDNIIEGVEVVSFTLQEDPGYTLGADTQADVNIADDVATVTLTLNDGAAAEAGQDTGMITVSRTDNGDTSQPFTVYMQRSGSATYSTDFLTSGMNNHGADRWSITIPANEFSASGTIIPRKDNIIEGTETTTFQLQEELTRFFISSLDPVDIQITDDVATVSLTLDDGAAAEAGQDAGMITVSRTDNGDTSQPFTVYMQRSGSATYSTDFLTSGMNNHGADRWSITIPANEFSASGTIIPRKDNIIEGTETTTFQLQEETTRFFISSLDPVDIQITDDVATVTLILNDGDADEQYEDPGQITVQRTDNGDISQPFTVYMRYAGSATYSTDFLTSGMYYHGSDRWSINIPSNQLTASGIITPRLDRIIEGDENLVFTLEEEATRFFTGKPDQAEITIKDLVEIMFKDGFEDP